MKISWISSIKSNHSLAYNLSTSAGMEKKNITELLLRLSVHLLFPSIYLRSLPIRVSFDKRRKLKKC